MPPHRAKSARWGPRLDRPPRPSVTRPRRPRGRARRTSTRAALSCRCRRAARRHAVVLAEAVPAVLHREAAVAARRHLDVTAAVVLGEVRDEVVRRLDVLRDELRIMKLPEVLESR